MLSDVVGRYLDSLEEREFDAPFIALLRALGYWDIHFLHGSFEFGKDFIAKAEVDGVSTQFAFQTKAGDINLKAWSECRGQIDMLRTDTTAHPSFDATLPRKAIFVTTGRLVGAAAAAAQQYRSYLAARGELDFTPWDKQDLIERITTDPQVLLASDSQGAFLTLIGQIDQGKTIESDIERYSRRWLSSPKTLFQLTIEAAVIAQRLRRAGAAGSILPGCPCSLTSGVEAVAREGPGRFDRAFHGRRRGRDVSSLRVAAFRPLRRRYA